MFWPVVVICTVVVLVLTFVSAAAAGGRRHGPRVVVTTGAGPSLASTRLREWSREPFTESGKIEPFAPADSPPGFFMPQGGQRKRIAGPADQLKGSVGAGADGSILAARAWLNVDPAVCKEAAQAAHAPIDHFPDLSSFSSLDSWAHLAAGAQHSLAGHVGEFIAQEHLQAAGLVVNMAESPYQQGWDAIAGGLHVNFKDYANFHSPGIAQHFASNPSIPIFTPGDTAHLPADALHISPGDHIDPATLLGHHVIVLDAWQHADAAQALQSANDLVNPDVAIHHALDLAAGGEFFDAAGAIDLGFPVVTALMSGYREGRLLFNGDTDTVRAAKNLSLDVGGVAGGGSLGHLIGGGIGFALGGPPGAFLGGFLGGLAGAVGGKIAAGEVRAHPLRQAVHHYDDAHDAFVEAARLAEKFARSTWEATSQAIQSEYKMSVESVVDLYDGFAATQQARAESASTFSSTTAQRAFERVRPGTDDISVAPYRHSRWLSLPGARQISYTAAVRQLRRDLARWDANCDRLLQSELERDDVLDMLAAVPDGDLEIDQFIASGQKARVRAYQAVVAASIQTQTAAVGLRSAAQERLEANWQRLQKQVDLQLEAPHLVLTEAEARLNTELRAAGKTPQVSAEE